MKTNVALLHGEMGRREDDFTAEIVDEAVAILKTVGFEAAEAFLDENLIDFAITRRVLSDQQRRRSADTAALVRFETAGPRRRLSS